MDVAARFSRIRSWRPALLLVVTLTGLATLAAGSIASAMDPADGAPLIDINTASADEMAAALPGIGVVKAQAIVEYRQGNGPFMSVDELVAVKGIGPKTLERLRPLITVGDELAAAARQRERATVMAVRRVIARARRGAHMARPDARTSIAPEAVAQDVVARDSAARDAAVGGAVPVLSGGHVTP